MKITVIGAGYVGLVSAACFSEFGYDVTCVDKETGKVKNLENGVMPIHEPGLDELVKSNVSAGRLRFATSLVAAARDSDIIFIAVGTPTRRGDDAADLGFVHAAAQEIASALSGYTVVVTKSTVPVGTAREITGIIARTNPSLEFDVASNPEFLREGSAVDDFMNPDRVIVGVESEHARLLMEQLYRPLSARDVPIVFTNFETSELIKYASNSYLATRLGFVNQLADLCEAVGADIGMVGRGMGLDSRIGQHYLQPGPGFGGSCFPKDTKAMAAIARDAGIGIQVVESVIASNERRISGLAPRVIEAMGGDVNNMRIAILGLSFKAETDDIRDSPAMILVPALRAAGAHISVYDPVVRQKTEPALDGVDWADSPYHAADGADALIVMTEWNEFRGLDFQKLAKTVRTPIMIDFRNLYSPEDIAMTPFTYHSIGRAPVHPKPFLAKQSGT